MNSEPSGRDLDADRPRPSSREFLRVRPNEFEHPPVTRQGLCGAPAALHLKTQLDESPESVVARRMGRSQIGSLDVFHPLFPRFFYTVQTPFCATLRHPYGLVINDH